MVEYNTVEGRGRRICGPHPDDSDIAPGRLSSPKGNEEKQAALLSGFVEITPER